MTEDPVPYDPGIGPSDRQTDRPSDPQPDLLSLARDLALAKASEETAKARRVAIEEQIAALVPPIDGKTQTTARAPGLKVTVKRPVRYKVDPECFKEGLAPEIYEGCFKHKESWDVVPSRYEALRSLNPSAFAALSRHITATPGKPAVELAWENPA